MKNDEGRNLLPFRVITQNSYFNISIIFWDFLGFRSTPRAWLCLKRCRKHFSTKSFMLGVLKKAFYRQSILHKVRGVYDWSPFFDGISPIIYPKSLCPRKSNLLSESAKNSASFSIWFIENQDVAKDKSTRQNHVKSIKMCSFLSDSVTKAQYKTK